MVHELMLFTTGRPWNVNYRGKPVDGGGNIYLPQNAVKPEILVCR